MSWTNKRKVSAGEAANMIRVCSIPRQRDPLYLQYVANLVRRGERRETPPQCNDAAHY